MDSTGDFSVWENWYLRWLVENAVFIPPMEDPRSSARDEQPGEISPWYRTFWASCLWCWYTDGSRNTRPLRRQNRSEALHGSQGHSWVPWCWQNQESDQEIPSYGHRPQRKVSRNRSVWREPSFWISYVPASGEGRTSSSGRCRERGSCRYGFPGPRLRRCRHRWWTRPHDQSACREYLRSPGDRRCGSLSRFVRWRPLGVRIRQQGDWFRYSWFVFRQCLECPDAASFLENVRNSYNWFYWCFVF